MSSLPENPALVALQRALGSGPLAARLPVLASSFVERRGTDLASLEISPLALRGLARVLASNSEVARYLATRPGLLSRLAGVDERTLAKRTSELFAAAPVGSGEDLETFLDQLRLFRRDETAFAACLGLAGLASFDEISRFLSVLAEAVVQRALDVAQERPSGDSEPTLAVLGMGKLAGRELTVYSDLDLIFLFEGGANDVAPASRIAQRLIHYLSTPTGAGLAYTVDARLRPSGRQGMLVTSYDVYTRYQRERAQTWEHLVLMRGRAIAGDRARGGRVLAGVQSEVRARGVRPWAEVAHLRGRIAAERTQDSEGRVAFKTAPGGLMDVDFLAAGALLERGDNRQAPEHPSVPAMLSTAVRGPAVDQVLEGYLFLRGVEARARWVAGRATEALSTSPDTLDVVTELVDPRLTPPDLLERIRSVRECIRTACERVLEAGTIAALGDPL